MALMAAKGEITPMPKCAIFADTKCEPLAVYKWLDWLEKELPFPVHRAVVDRGLLSHIVKSVMVKGRFAGAPFFTESENAGGGKLRRQCTKEFKLEAIRKKVRDLVGLGYKQVGPKRILVVQWIGISTDESSRIKPSRDRYIQNRWPLAMELSMSRHDCLTWMKENSFPEPPRSACTFCPFHSDAEWRRLKKDERSWRQIVAVDRIIRQHGGVRGTKQKLYLHRSLKPIDEVDFSTEEERGQVNMFNNECEGMCGV